MTAPYQRRRDPQPVSQGWEIAAAAIGGALLGLGLAALAGLGLASALFGGGWVWPHGSDTIGHVIGGVLAGHPGQGLPLTQLELVASPGAVYGCIAGCELIVIMLAVAIGVLVSRYRRPNDARSGMATRSEADLVLGVSQLRAAQEIIRPDRYPRAGLQPSPSRVWRRPHLGPKRDA
ncbi:conjugal transfer protein [uncultured Jatrophihabitans sp.]|uniref:conjugal transfer protein n=1 Tax=uncultured Jatrophihabitans sp. TaxID=1610747 RepID=UPI0035C9E476